MILQPLRRPVYLNPPIVSFILATALFAVTLGGNWVYDDVFIAKGDPRLHDLHQWRSYLTEGYFPDAVDNLWRPLTSLSFAFQWQLHGGRAWAFHAVNILLHATASAMVAMLAGWLGRRNDGVAAYVAGLLFAAHPLHVEAVAYLVGRAESMAAIGIIGGLLLVIDRPMTPRRAMAVTGCFLTAVFAKEQGLLLPVLIVAWKALTWRQRRDSPAARMLLSPSPGTPGEGRGEGFAQSGPDSLPGLAAQNPHPNPLPEYRERGKEISRQGALWLASLLLISLAAYISYRDSILKWVWQPVFIDPVLNPIARSQGLDRWLLPVAILGRYAQLLIAPLQLSPDYSADVFTPRQSLHDPYLYTGFVVMLLYFIAILIALLYRRKVAMFCLIGLGISGALVGNWMIIGTVFGERLMYLPSVFVCLLAGLGTARIAERTRPLVVYAIVALLVGAGSIRTVTYAWEWNDSLRLLQYAQPRQPKSAMLYLLLAAEYQYHGQDVRAGEVYRAARAACPDCWSVFNDSAIYELAHDRLDDAEVHAIIAHNLLTNALSPVGLIERIQARRAATRAATKPAFHATVP